MPGANVDIGTGTTITFGTSGFNAQIESASWGGITREIIDVTHLGTTPASGGEIGSREYLAGDLSDPGELTLELHFNPNLQAPIEGDPETITVTYPLVSGDTTSASWSAQGQMTGYDHEIPLEDKMTATATVKITGPITRTDAT